MRKLYVKKLGSIALMSLAFFGIYFLATFLLQTFVNFIESNLVKALIFLAIPAVILVIRIYRRRLRWSCYVLRYGHIRPHGCGNTRMPLQMRR